MLELNDITLDKKEFINEFLRRRKSKNSEFSFSYLYMWRKSYDMKYAVIDDMLCVLPKHTDGPRSASFPIGFENPDGTTRSIKHFIDELLDYFKESGDEPLIHLYDENTMKMLVEEFPDKFIITEDRNNFDYVYRIDELTKLAGKKFHSKKNHINRFKKLYPDWEYCRLTPENNAECMKLFDEWQVGKGWEAESISEERESICEFLNSWASLGYIGGGLRVGGRLVAFTFGEPLCGDTVVIHFEHVDPECEGAFTMINQQFLEHEWQDYTYVNREEDMGIPGMRKAKESYHPVFMIKKYVATLK